MYKELDGIKCDLWDDIVDFKYVYVPEHDIYYEITVSISDSNKTVKHCVGVSAGECELSQRYLRDFHVNDEVDILMDDYVITVFYNPSNPKGSLLDRVLHDKCPDWSIGHVDGTIANIQRTFSANETTVYDFLTKTVAEEIGCLFLFDSVRRQISAYDLKNKCNNCGFRGEFIDKCPKCNSMSFTPGYGTWQNVYVSPDNVALQIDVQGDTDSVKNCFKIEGGDDLITATVANLNPNKSNYIYRFSDAMRADMPTELVDALDSYDELYNQLLADYQQYTEDYYEAVDDELYYQTSMMPETPIPEDTTAQEQLDILMGIDFSVAVQDLRSLSNASADLAVKGYAKVLVDPRYTVEVSETSVEPYIGVKKWSGKFTVKSLGGVNEQGNPDEATSDTPKEVIINDDYEVFLKQKIDKALARGEATFTTIFNIEDDEDFKEALTLYSLDSLTSFYNSYQSVLEILVQQGVPDQNAMFYDVNLYDEMYLPNYNRQGWVAEEMVVREGQVQECIDRIDEANEHRDEIQDQLNLRNYLGEELYRIFVLYLREDTYSNGNYISDGLDNVEVIDKAKELLSVAEDELRKASEIQVSLNGSLNNFLNTEEFINFKSKFEIGDWIICKADDKLYKLRLINVGYTYDDPTNLSATFSNVTRAQNYASDINDVLNKATSMASSYSYVAHQANQGDEANIVLDGFLSDGVDTASYKIYAGDSESIKIDEHGITAKSYDDILGDFSPEQLKITHNALVFTNDNWETAILGLGKQEYSKYDSTLDTFVTVMDYGLSTRFVQSGYIQGSEMVAGDIYSSNYSRTDNTGTHINLNNGTFSFADGNLTYDGSDLSYEGNMIITGGSLTVEDENENILFMADIDNSIVNIGGFSVEDNAIYNGTNAIDSTTPGIYIGTDGIRSYQDSTHYVDIKNGGLTANSGTIGGFTIGTSSIYNGMTSLSDTTHNGVYVGTNGIALGKGNFKVTSAGALNSTSGFIGGWSINSSSIYKSGTSGSFTYNSYVTPYNIRVSAADSSDGTPSGYAQIATGYISLQSNRGSTNKNITLDADGNTVGLLDGATLKAYYLNAYMADIQYLDVTVSKHRKIETDDYGLRTLSSYETPSPMFGDIGSGIIGEDGLCYVWIEPIFRQTIITDSYEVFIQKYGEGDCYILKRTKDYFIVKGTPRLEFAWELKGKQIDYGQGRLDPPNWYPYNDTIQYGEIADDILQELYVDYGEQAIEHMDEIKDEREV